MKSSSITVSQESLHEQFSVEQSEIGNRLVWKLCGDSSTVPNKIWNVVTSLAKLQCSIQSIICTIRKQYDSITVTQINNAIGILQSSKIIAVNDKIASVTPSEKQFLTEISS